MLAALASAVAPGGVLVLVTCSIEREENEEVAESFLSTHGGFRREREAWRIFPGDGHDGFSVSVFRREA
jgi:16S rRNA C967 or C1407 C5-methylase (RsmB/RsmF family)